MIPEPFFEADPWSYTVEHVKSGLVGQVKAVAVHIICALGSVDPTAQAWMARLEEFLGQPTEKDVIESESAVSMVARYDGPVIVRVFFDSGAGQQVSNFEVVGTEGLLIWKPERHAISIMHLTSGEEVTCGDDNAFLLERMVTT